MNELSIFMNEIRKLLEVEKRYHFNVWCMSDGRVVKKALASAQMNKWAIVNNTEVVQVQLVFFFLSLLFLYSMATDRKHWTEQNLQKIFCMAKWMALLFSWQLPSQGCIMCLIHSNDCSLSVVNIIIIIITIIVICKRSLWGAFIWHFRRKKKKKN